MIFDLWLASVTGVRSDRRIAAAVRLGGAEAVYRCDKGELFGLGVFSDEDIRRIEEDKKRADPEYEWENFLKSGTRLIPYYREEYPKKLLNIEQQPYALFVKGKLPEDIPGRKRNVAIVGARMCSEYGRSIATELGRSLAGAGISIISGMALGIDSAAHSGALLAKGATFAVLGCGCDICYPRSAVNIYNNILDSGGGIISEYPLGEKPISWHFPERNRIISGLSDAVIVAEAKKKSGSLITADFALDQGRDVYAVPGRIGDALSYGTNLLIAEGAGIVCSVQSFVQAFTKEKMEAGRQRTEPKIPLEKDEGMVYSCLDLHPKSINIIIEETGISLLEAIHYLEDLKGRGLIREPMQNYYCRFVR